MKELIIKALKNSLTKLNITYQNELKITRPKDKENGDYSSNIALKLAGVLKKNPLEIAKDIVANFSCPDVYNIEIKAPVSNADGLPFEYAITNQ